MLALLLALLIAPGAPAQQPGPAPAGIECSTCKGAGRAQQDCFVCTGTRQVGCGTCAPMWRLPSAVDPDADLRSGAPDPNWVELIGSLRELRESYTKTFGECAPGQARCPGSCREGKGILNPGKPCKFCAAKGSLPCPQCKRKGALRCASCDGRGQILRACEDCLGSGRRPDPVRIAPEHRATCPACASAGKWACRECDETGLVEAACRACNAEGRMPCRHCLGTRQKPCQACSATGDNTGFLGPKKSNRCVPCDGKGLLPCNDCNRGVPTCAACNGKREKPQTCLACYGTHVRLCAGCARNGFRAWELAGDTLLAAGDKAGARAFLEIARGRVDAHYTRLAERSTDPKADAAALEKQRKAQCERLDKRLAATQAPAK